MKFARTVGSACRRFVAVVPLAALWLLVALLGTPPAAANDSPYGADFGDAPDGQNAGYAPPFAGVVGQFPTYYTTGNSRFGLPGAHTATTGLETLGTLVSLEDGPDDVADPDTVENLIDDDFDDGLVGGPCPFGSPPVPWVSPISATLTLRVTVAPAAPAMTRYINVLIDANHDGVWSAPGEWIAIDQPVVVAPGTSALITVGPIALPLAAAGAWTRVSLTRTPVVGSFVDDGSGWDGSGTFSHGEIEDYQLSSVTSGLDYAAAAAAASASAQAYSLAVDADFDSASAFAFALAQVDVSADVAAAVAAAASASAAASAAATASASASASASAAAVACASALAYANSVAVACASCACASVCASAQASALAAVEACAQAQSSATVAAAASAFAAAAAAAEAAAAAAAEAEASASASAFAVAFAAAEAHAAAIAVAQASAAAAAAAAATSASAALTAACDGDVTAATAAAAAASVSAAVAASAFAIATAEASADASAYALARAKASAAASARVRAVAAAGAGAAAQASASSAASAATAASATASSLLLALTSASAEVSAACSGDCCPNACAFCYSLRVTSLGALSTQVSWSTYSGAISYDLVAGSLGGPFSCLADNTPEPSGTDPGIALAPGAALFYLQRSFSGLEDDSYGHASDGQERPIPPVCDGGCDVAVCDDDNVCTTDACDSPSGGCTHILADCDDFNPCTQDSCSPASGCVLTPRAALCDDGSACTAGDACLNGQCAGTLVGCDDENPCTADSCDPGTGCAHSPVSGTCDDESACTLGDQCTAGLCGGTPLSCDDASPCTTDYCNPELGCGHTPHTGSCSDGNPCTTGDTCAVGTCVGGPPLDCNDGNACTDDVCTPTGCQATPRNSGACDDGDACTAGDQCSAGNCTPTGPTNCADGTPCTDDLCHSVLGCQHPNNDAPACDDGNPCTTGDHCSAGSCDATPVPPTTTSLTNGTPINIPPAGQAIPYPTMISFPPLGSITKAVVRLNGFNHGVPDDIDIYLVGPSGQNAIILSDVGGNIPVNGAVIVLDDAAPGPLPDNGPLNSGTFVPTNIGPPDPFPPPAPPPSGNSALGVFNGSPSAGNWGLFVADDSALNPGSIGGWTLTLTTVCVGSLESDSVQKPSTANAVREGR